MTLCYGQKHRYFIITTADCVACGILFSSCPFIQSVLLSQPVWGGGMGEELCVCGGWGGAGGGGERWGCNKQCLLTFLVVVFFFFSMYLCANLYTIKLFSGTTAHRILKLGSNVGYNPSYLRKVKRPAPAYSFICLLFFLSLQLNC